jgi:hypothetical protein
VPISQKGCPLLITQFAILIFIVYIYIKIFSESGRASKAATPEKPKNEKNQSRILVQFINGKAD